jgi:phage host-nuclease inhibitor protein Gam
MAKVTRIKTDAARYPVPQTRAEAVSAIAEIGNRQRDRERLKADMDDEIVKIRERYDKLIAPHNDDITGLSSGVHTWCEANRADLTNQGRVKTANLMAGEVRWRMRPPSVGVRNQEAVIQALKDLRMARFIRTREELNKEAILAEPEAVQHIKGLTITQREDFIIVPFETNLEEVA